jgi:hypothetical protein
LAVRIEDHRVPSHTRQPTSQDTKGTKRCRESADSNIFRKIIIKKPK